MSEGRNGERERSLRTKGRRGEEGEPEENRRWFLTFLRVSSASKRRE